MATLSVCSMAEPAVAASIPSPNLQGYDISFPNCRDHQFPASPGYFTVIGVNGGKAYTTNPCFGEQYQWASASGQLPAVYINLNYPRDASAANGRTGPRGTCPPEDAACLAYNYGYNAAQFAVTTAHSQGVSPTNWWLDIETANYWSPNQALNAQVIQGAIDYLQSQNLHVGIYSVVSMWQTIAGSFAPGLPNWVAQTNSKLPASAFCSSAFAFGGGTVSMVQSWDGKFDLDIPCGNFPVDNFAQSAMPASMATPTTGPVQLTGPTTGSLAGSGGGTNVSYLLAYPGNNQPRKISFVYWPAGAQVGNALFVQVIQNGQVLATHRATEGSAPGQLQIQFTSGAAGPVTILITNYNNPSTTPPVGYWIRPS